MRSVFLGFYLLVAAQIVFAGVDERDITLFKRSTRVYPDEQRSWLGPLTGEKLKLNIKARADGIVQLDMNYYIFDETVRVPVELIKPDGTIMRSELTKKKYRLFFRAKRLEIFTVNVDYTAVYKPGKHINLAASFIVDQPVARVLDEDGDHTVGSFIVDAAGENTLSIPLPPLPRIYPKHFLQVLVFKYQLSSIAGRMVDKDMISAPCAPTPGRFIEHGPDGERTLSLDEFWESYQSGCVAVVKQVLRLGESARQAQTLELRFDDFEVGDMAKVDVRIVEYGRDDKPKLNLPR